MVVQDGELAEKRLAEERRLFAADVRQELLAEVERIRLTAMSPSGVPAVAAQNPEIALIARVEGGRLVLPWDDDPRTIRAREALERPDFREAIATGEQYEFAAGRLDEATAAYERAVHTSRLPVQRASAQLHVARTLTKSHRPDANRTYRALLDVPLDVVDDQGIPFAFYAIRRLVASSNRASADTSTIVDVLRQAVTSHSMTPAALYMADDLLADIGVRPNASGSTNVIGNDIARRIHDVEQAMELQRSFATVGLFALRSAGPVWKTFGPSNNVWLVAASEGDAPRVVAVRAAPMIASLRTLSSLPGGQLATIGESKEGEPLGPNFPELRLSLTGQAADAFGAAHRLPKSLYLTSLILVVSIALFGSYLFWRDVRREMRVAEMRSQFVSSVSHELKTPLTAIRMFAETLLLGRSRPEIREEYLETIVNESERLTRLVNDVLDFSKIEQGKKTYRFEPLSLEPIVHDAIKAMQYPAGQQGFDLRVHIDDRPSINADADGIRQAILNLLSNAMKYSGDSRVIELRLGRNDTSAVISVTDRGIGIPLHEQARIFERFYRVRDESTQRIPGAGLGLALVEHVACAHGGSVSVTSVSGKGSTFSMLIPLVQTSTTAIAPTKVLA